MCACVRVYVDGWIVVGRMNSSWSKWKCRILLHWWNYIAPLKLFPFTASERKKSSQYIWTLRHMYIYCGLQGSLRQKIAKYKLIYFYASIFFLSLFLYVSWLFYRALFLFRVLLVFRQRMEMRVKKKHVNMLLHISFTLHKKRAEFSAKCNRQEGKCGAREEKKMSIKSKWMNEWMGAKHK